MGNRYGRNQKRAARAKIAALESTTARLSRDINRRHEDLHELRQAVKDIGEVLGREFIGLPVHELVMRVEDTIENPNNFFCSPSGYGGAELMRSMSVRINSQASADEPGRQVHVLVGLRGQVSGYAISESALHYAPADVLARNMARVLASHLVKAIKSDVMKENRRG